MADFTVEQLKEFLCIEGSQYGNFSDLRRFVIVPALKDINKYTDLEVDFKVKKGVHNKVVAVFFSVGWKGKDGKTGYLNKMNRTNNDS